MNNVLKSFLLCIVLLSFLCCQSSKYIYLESYDNVSKIKLSQIYVSTGEQRGIYPAEFEHNNQDSISTLFLSEISNLQININLDDKIKNETTKNVWVNKKEKAFPKYRNIDTTYIKSIFDRIDDSIMNLIPVITYVDVYEATIGGTQYYIHLDVSVFLIQNGRIIYSMNEKNRTNSIFYVTEKEKAQLMSEIDLQGLWKKTVTEVMQPYLDRLQN
jgi:hypothetical protein